MHLASSAKLLEWSVTGLEKAEIG